MGPELWAGISMFTRRVVFVVSKVLLVGRRPSPVSDWGSGDSVASGSSSCLPRIW